MVSKAKLKKIALLTGGAALYLFLNPDLWDSLFPAEEPTCEPGYELTADKSLCVDPTGVTQPQCGEGFVISEDGAQCLDTRNPCGSGFVMVNGECEEEPKVKDTVTGSELGDFALYFGESIVAGIIFDILGRKVGTVIQRKAAALAAKEAAAKAAKETAKKAAEATAKAVAAESARIAEQKAMKVAADKAAQKAMRGAAGKVATTVLAPRVAQLAAKKTAERVALIAAKKLVAKIGAMTIKMAALASTGIGVILTPLTAISISLSIALLAAGDKARFEKDSPDDKDWETVPEGARVAIEAVPLIGDIISIIAPFVAFKEGCPAGTAEQNGLCYEPPKPGFECEAFLCYAHDYPGFNPLSETQAHLTKRILMDTGTIPDRCPPGQSHGAGGAFCYDDRPGMDVVAGTAWERCNGDETDAGALCSKMDPCPAGEHDVGGTCWGVVRQDCAIDCITKPASGGASHGGGNCRGGGCRGGECRTTGGGCRRECHGDPWKAVWENGHQECRDICDPVKTECVPITCDPVVCDPIYTDPIVPCGTTCWNVEGIKTQLHQRMHTRTKRSEVLTPHSNVCEPGKTNIGDLCYGGIPEGYTRKVLGTLDQTCPGDKEEWKGLENFNPTQDIGVSCQRATYTRKPWPKLAIYGKHLFQEPPDPPPPPPLPLCSTLPTWPRPASMADVSSSCVCRSSETPAGYELADDGNSFFKKCMEFFVFNSETKSCDKIENDGSITHMVGPVSEVLDYEDGIAAIAAGKTPNEITVNYEFC